MFLSGFKVGIDRDEYMINTVYRAVLHTMYYSLHMAYMNLDWSPEARRKTIAEGGAGEYRIVVGA